jgi:hypothetical protein
MKMNFIRRYGWYVFLIPGIVFILDDIATNWHDHGHERLLYIVLENLGEDLAVFLLLLIFAPGRTVKSRTSTPNARIVISNG